MPCYPCSHCNKCGIFSMRLEIRCATCGADVVVGQADCPECGMPYANNTVRGKMGKVEGSVDYFTEIAEARGDDAFRTVDMGNVI